MQLNPRYGSDPVLVLDGDPAAVAVPTIRQRRRLAERLAGFDADDWNHPTRCDGWTARDVVAHLGTGNWFWEMSIRSGLEGNASRLLETFDPVASPAEMVAAIADDGAAVLEQYTASVASLTTLLESLRPSDWEAIAESPPGHVSVSAVAHHALWDSWVHERDIFVPMGEEQDVEPDEIEACLRYVAALAPALALNASASASGSFVVSASDPVIRFGVEIGECVSVVSEPDDSVVEIRGDAVGLLDALSIRGPLEADIPASLQWAFVGLSTVFDN